MTTPTTEARRQIVAGLVRQNPSAPLAAVRRSVLAHGHQVSNDTLRKDVALIRGEIEQELIERRRVLVAQFMVRHLTRRAMLTALAGADFHISYSTLDRDIAAVKVAWKEQCAQAVEEHRARRLAEDIELRRMLWHRLAGAQTDRDAARLASEIRQSGAREDARHGLDAPTKFAPTTPDGAAPYDPLGLTDEERADRVATLLDAARARRAGPADRS